MSTKIVSIEDAMASVPDPEGKRFAQVFAHGSLVVEMFAPRGTDTQTPHSRDEVYVVASGRGEFVSGDKRMSFGPNDFLFVRAGIAHRFENFTNDLFVWVLFYGPEGGEGDQ